jgi:hypothetical protein
MKASRTRAGMLVVALALVGGTGCITTAIVQNARKNARTNERLREEEAARQERIARLAPAAEAGDPVAETDLARALMAVPAPGQVDQQRVFTRLSKAAEQGYGPAQALLGAILVSGQIQAGNYRRVPVAPAFQDRERGIRMLMQAATQACNFKASDYRTFSSISPAYLLGSSLTAAGQADEAMVWRARWALHCSVSGGDIFFRQIMAKNTTPPQRIQLLTLLLVTADDARIAQAEAALSAEEVAAARRDSGEFRRRLAQSIQQYPAPTRKEMP